MKFDEILYQLGNYGPYQRRTHLLICLISIPSAFHLLCAVFLVAEPEFRCALPGYEGDSFEIQNDTHRTYVDAFIPKAEDGSYEKCKVYKDIDFSLALQMKQINESLSLNTTVACKKWVYDKSVFTSTVVTDFDLVCEDHSKTTIAGVVFMGGVLVGSFAFGVLSDGIGRKKSMVLGMFLSMLSGMGIAFAPDYYTFTILRFILGGCDIGMYISGYVIATEFIGPKARIFGATLISIFFTVGYVILAGLAYLIRDWRKLQIAISIPWVLYLSYWWLVPESARWLLSKGREEEAEEIIRNAAKSNKVELPEKLFDEVRDDTAHQKTLTLAQLPRELGKAPKLLVRILIMFFNWFAVSMVYYGLSLNSGDLGGDIFFNFLLGGLVEFPAKLFSMSCHYLGRKGPFVFGNILGGLACVSTIFVVIYYESNNTALIALSMVGKFGATNGFVEAYFWACEIYPTVARNGLMGISSAFARVGSMLASPVGDMNKFIPGTMGVALPQIIFGSVSIIGGLLSLHLPETKDQKLPESIEDCETTDYSTNSKKAEKTKEASKLDDIHLVTTGQAEIGEDNLAVNIKDEEAYL